VEHVPKVMLGKRGREEKRREEIEGWRGGEEKRREEKRREGRE
jgi:hypothetical protein